MKGATIMYKKRKKDRKYLLVSLTITFLMLIATKIDFKNISYDLKLEKDGNQNDYSESNNGCIILNKNTNIIKAEYFRKVDGDTSVFLINGKETKCRFLAIDTPETVKQNTPIQPYGKVASDYTDNVLKNSEEIYLEFDKNSDKYDKYGRMLVWVWHDEKLLQEELLKKGYAELKYINGDYKYLDCLRTIEDDAKRDHLGIWKN